jgi:hypothetical protein
MRRSLLEANDELGERLRWTDKREYREVTLALIGWTREMFVTFVPLPQPRPLESLSFFALLSIIALCLGVVIFKCMKYI